MASILNSLPAPKHNNQRDEYYGSDRRNNARSSSSLAVVSGVMGKGKIEIPPYGRRSGWIPRTQEAFGDGGAYPEIHVAQYPLEMGKKDDSSQKTVPITLDSSGKIKYESIIDPSGERQIMAKHSDLTAKLLDSDELQRPDEETEAEITKKTREALEKIVTGKISNAQPTNAGVQEGKGPTYIRYTPTASSINANSAVTQRVIRLSEAPSDPLEPPKFKLKKVPKGPPSPPVPVMHSPPRKITVKDQQDWKIPPCISNWKNNKGYTIPLDKRLAADGRGLQDVQINDNFAKLSEALYIAERTSREEVSKRAEVARLISIKEKEKKEEVLRKLAQEARMERATAQVENDSEEEEEEEVDEAENDKVGIRERQEIMESRRRERERDLRMQRNRSAAARNADRDVSERLALGQAVANPSSETLYDQRLFNQSQGMSAGFGDEESYNIYSKPLFSGSQAASNMLHRPKKDAETEGSYGGEADYNKLLDTSKFKPDKDFSGVNRDKETAKQARSGPVEFEQESDPFGLDEFLQEAKKSSGSKVLDKIGSSGHMKVSSANVEGANDGGSKRGRIDFESGSNNHSKSSNTYNSERKDDKRRRN